MAPDLPVCLDKAATDSRLRAEPVVSTGQSLVEEQVYGEASGGMPGFSLQRRGSIQQAHQILVLRQLPPLVTTETPPLKVLGKSRAEG